MQVSNKYKTTISCSCKQCKRYSKYKQFAYRQSKRKLRHIMNQRLNNLWNLDDVVMIKVSAGYTD